MVQIFIMHRPVSLLCNFYIGKSPWGKNIVSSWPTFLDFDIKCLEWVQITVFSIGNRQWHSVHCCPQRTCFTQSLLGPQTLLKHLDHTQGGWGNKGFLGGAVVKRRHGFVEIPRSGRSPGAGNATHSSILAWKVAWTEEPGGLQSRGSQRVR